MKAYCVKCKEKQEMDSAEAVFTKTGTPGTSGICSVCGTKMFRMGRTDAHEGMTPPENTRRTAKQPKPREGKLVIVESPAKARTIGRYLGDEFKVVASVGHIRDLLKSKLSIDIDNHFEPTYRVPNDKRDVMREIKQLGAEAAEIFLATDLDREGEAIAWHLIEAAELDPELTHRVVFSEITRDAIREAFADPADLDMKLVNAQQARRVVDRLVGYQISPILWEKVRGGLATGRVQSVALRLVVDREREIDAFVPEEYWTVAAELSPEDAGQGETYIANLTHVDGKKFHAGSQADVDPILSELKEASFEVRKVRRGTRERNPYPPFITSTLQQDASRQLNFSAKKTMAVAQQLYQGIDVGNGGETGLITYMRTDSTNLAESAQLKAREFIQNAYGADYIPEQIPQYTTKNKAAQEAHEAIRPTSVSRTPKSIKNYLKNDQYRLYKLIWRRFVASQMASAVYDTLSVIVGADGAEHAYVLRASGSRIRFPGFLKVYDRKNGNGNSNAEKNLESIPADLEEGQSQRLVQLLPEQHFTKPPARYSEATLVSALEENGIGRPSTYAPILGKLVDRSYVVKEGRRLAPTETGFIVNDLVSEYFSSIVDVGFTAEMERELDRVASGEIDWQDSVAEFYEPFADQLAYAKEEMPKIKPKYIPVGKICPECGQNLVQRFGRYGLYIGCSNPDCGHTERWVEKIGVSCPNDGGELIQKKTRKGRIFFGCENYPECDFASWKRPLPTPCPHCGGLLVESNKKHAVCENCSSEFKRADLKKTKSQSEPS